MFDTQHIENPDLEIGIVPQEIQINTMQDTAVTYQTEPDAEDIEMKTAQTRQNVTEQINTSPNDNFEKEKANTPDTPQDSEEAKSQVKFDLMPTKERTDSKITIIDDVQENRHQLIEDQTFDVKAVFELPLIERATHIAESIFTLIKARNECVVLLSIYNQLLLENHKELIEILANETPQRRAFLVQKLFYEIVSETNKEVYIQKHLYLKQIVLLARNIVVNFFAPLIREHSMFLVVEEIYNNNAQIFKSLSDSRHNTHNVSLKGEIDGNKVKWINKESLKSLYTISLSDAEWRENIKVGDYIDAICKYQAPNCTQGHKTISCWQPAKVIFCDYEGNLLISFLRCQQKLNLKVQRLSGEIAPHKKYTNSWDWRFNLKVDDEISSADDYGNWYRSTVLKITELPEKDIDGQSVPQILVAFRYLDPNGIKEDEKGRKCTGWISQKFDSIMLLAQPNVQPLFSMTYQYFNVVANMQLYDINVSDLEDWIYPSSQVHEWARKRNEYFGGISCYADILNEFGDLGGFEIIVKLLEEVAKGQFIVSVNYLLSIQSFLRNTLPLWTRQFCCSYVEQVSNAYMNAIISEKSQILSQCEKSDLERLFQSYEQILKRNFMPKRYEQMTTKLKIKLGVSLVASENLTRRIAGINYVNDELRNIQRLSNKDETLQEIMKDFQKTDFFNQVFHSRRIHLQILQRSHEIIKLYAKTNQLSMQNIDLLWDSTLIQENYQLEVYKVLQESSGVIPDEILETFINKIKNSMEPSKTTQREVDFIHSVGKNSYYKSSARQQALNVLWQISMMERPGYSKLLLKPSLKHLFDLIRTQDREVIETYVAQTIQIIEKKTGASVQATKFLLKLFASDKIPKYVYQNSYGGISANLSNLSQFIKNLCVSHGLIETILDDLENYIIGQGLDEGYTHRKAVWTRLRALLYIQNTVEDITIPSADQVNRAWIMLFNESSDATDTSLFFDWFHSVLSNNEWCFANTEMICQFFQSQVLNNQSKILSQSVHVNGFQCIQKLFMIVNEKQNNLNVLNRSNALAQAKFTNNESKRNKVQFKIHIKPEEMIGIELIWQFFIASCNKQDNDALKTIITNFLAQIYVSTSQLMSHQLNQIYYDFTNQCFSHMRNILSDQNSDSNVKSEVIKNTMLLLQAFFQDTEKVGGTAGIRPHAALDSEVYYIQNLLVTCFLNTTGNQPKHLQMNLPSNMTVWEFIDYIAKKTEKSPLKISFSRSQGKPELSQDDFCKSLRQMNFESNEEITVLIKNTTCLRVPLINPQTGMLVKDAEHIFQTWFNNNSVPASEIENFDPEISQPAERYMTKQTCVNFLKNQMADTKTSVVQAKTITVDDHRIVTLFNQHDTDKDGLLTLQDFLRFYRIKSVESPETVWLNLQVHGYGNNLMKEVKGDSINVIDPQVTRDQSTLPRCLISENIEQLEMLFNLQSADQKSNDQILRLIGSLKTNSEIYKRILQAENPIELLTPNQPIFKLQYYLQIMKHLLQKQTAQEQSLKPIAKLYIERSLVVPDSEYIYKQKFPSLDETLKEDASNSQVDEVGNNMIDTKNLAQKSKKPPTLESIEEDTGGSSTKEIKLINLGVAGNHWEKPQVATGEVIALPSAADYPQENAGNSEKLSYNQKQILNWKGSVIFDEIITGDTEQADLINQIQEQEDWFIKFLLNGGFQALVNLLNHFVENNTISTSQANRNCVKLVTYMIKVILMSTFCAGTVDTELMGALTRKMSSTSNSTSNIAPAQQPVQNQDYVYLENKQKEIQQEFKPVIDLLQLNQFKPENLLPDDPQLKQIQGILQQTFKVILSNNQQSIIEDERLIVAECLNIWISLITFSSERLNDLYNDENYLNIFIINGLMSENAMLRDQFKEALQFISFRIKQEDLPIAPALFFLHCLLKNQELICLNFKAAQTQQYQTLLLSLLQNYYDIKQTKPVVFKEVFNARATTIKTLEILHQYQSIETRSKNVVDYTLVGLLTLVSNLLKYETNLLSIQESSIVLTFLVEKCLFNQQAQEFNEHITSNVDLSKLQVTTMNKCHSEESRDAAYGLFQALIGNENPDVQVLQNLIRNYWSPKIMQLSDGGSLQNNSKDRPNRSEYGFAGLKNLGCICYINAMMQQFYHVPAFRYCLLAANDNQPQNLVTLPNGHQLDDNSLHQWMRLFGFLELSERQDYNPEDFCYAFKQGGQPTNVRVQQDAQEFLGLAFDKLEESLKNTQMKNLCQSVFQGINTNITLCKTCNNIRQTDETFYSLQLQVTNFKDIYGSLQSLVAGEIITGYKCDACKNTVDIVKRPAIKKLPNTLILHLNRLKFDFDLMRHVKLNDRIEFPTVLNMQNFMLDEILKEVQIPAKKNDEDAKEDNESEQMIIDDSNQTEVVNENKVINSEDFEYKLVGVVIHMGVADAGHYISYINIARDQDSSVNSEEWLKTENQTWLEFNDSFVKPFDFNLLGYKCFGENPRQSTIQTQYNINTIENYQDETNIQSATSHNAYMLVYEKRVKSPITLVLDQQTIETISLACDGTTNTRDLQQIHSVVTCPSLIQKVKNQQYDKDLQIEVSFTDIKKFIPNQIYKMINTDNQLHIAESQICCNPFFKTTFMLLNNLAKNCVDPESIVGLYNLIDKLIFCLLINTTQNKEIGQLTQILIDLFKKQPELLIRIVEERILFTQKIPGNVCEQPFFEMLIFHTSQEAREMAEQILTQVTNTLFELLDFKNSSNFTEQQLTTYQNMLDRIIEIVVNLIPDKLVNAWHKLGAFFNFIYNTVKDQQWSRLITFRQVKLVSRFVDLISKTKDHFQNGYNFGTPPIENAVKTVCLLIRTQPLIIWLYKLPIWNQVTIEEYQNIISIYGESPYKKQIQDQDSNFYLDSEDVRNIFMTEKRNRFFWDLCLQYAGSIQTLEEVSLTISHCCYKNFDFSRKMAKVLLAGLNKTQSDDLKPFALCMQYFITIKDEFQMQRIEWLFGIPSIVIQRTANIYNQDNRIQNSKIGCNKITDFTDMVYEYQTSLLKDQNKMSETILYMLYNYRKSGFAEVIIVLLENILNAILMESSGVLLEFLLNTVGPSYTCRRYWDWFEPFVLQNIQDSFSANNTNTATYTEINFRIIEKIQKIKVQFAQKLEQIQGPQPYLQWDIIGSKDYSTTVVDDKHFHVVLSEITTTISKSTPVPEEQRNDNLIKENRGNWSSSSVVFKAVSSKQKTQTQNQKVYQNTEVNVAKSFGRGIRRANQSVNEKVINQKIINSDDKDFNKNDYEQTEKMSDDNEMMPELINDNIDEHKIESNKNLSEKMQKSDDENPDNWSQKFEQGSDMEFDQDTYPQNNQDQSETILEKENVQEQNFYVNPPQDELNDNKDIEPIEVDESDDQIPPVIKSSLNPSPGEDLGGVANNEEEKIQDDYQTVPENTFYPTGQEAPFEDSMQHSEEEVEDETAKYKVETIMQLTLRNFSRNKPQRCTLVFDQSLRNQANYSMPYAALNQMVNRTTDHTFLRFQKLRPYEGWGNIQFEILIDQEDSLGNNQKWSNNWPELRRKKEEMVVVPNSDPVPNPVIDSQPNPVVIVGQDVISCPVCTFDNDPLLSVCEMCSNSLR